MKQEAATTEAAINLHASVIKEDIAWQILCQSERLSEKMKYEMAYGYMLGYVHAIAVTGAIPVTDDCDDPALELVEIVSPWIDAQYGAYSAS